MKFDAATWRAGDQRIRGAMVEDILARRLLDGSSRPEVLEMLGPADSQDQALGYRVDTGHRFGFKPWPYTLMIDFDDAETVSTCCVMD